MIHILYAHAKSVIYCNQQKQYQMCQYDVEFDIKHLVPLTHTFAHMLHNSVYVIKWHWMEQMQPSPIVEGTLGRGH